MMEMVYLVGMVPFIWMALLFRNRDSYNSFVFDLATTVLIMLWPLTVMLLILASIANRKKT